MNFNQTAFQRLVDLLTEINPLGDGDSPPPAEPAAALTAATLRTLIAQGTDHLPLAYRQAYVEPVFASIDFILQSDDQQAARLNAETLAGAIYQHRPDSPLRHSLRQVLAVVSNYHRSFLSAAKRRAIGFPETLLRIPPVAVFSREGQHGPFMFPAEMVSRLCGSQVAVISLPERLSRHPVWWTTAAHETVGHSVLNGDPELLPELASGVFTLFSGGLPEPGEEPKGEQLKAILWSYWIEECASDVYAVLNSGPAFAYNLAAFLEAVRPDPRMEALHMPSRWQPLPVHPPLPFRLFAMIGVIENLVSLPLAIRRKHLTNLRTLATKDRIRSVPIRGRIEVNRDWWIDVDRSIGFRDLATAAQRVGSYIATARLRAFGGRSVQEIETWDTKDELIADMIASRLLIGDRPGSIAHLGDDAQLLAGTTLAAMVDPGRYEGITTALQVALGESFRWDPVFGLPNRHAILSEPVDAPPATGAGA